jgi:hypothetical protein
MVPSEVVPNVSRSYCSLHTSLQNSRGSWAGFVVFKPRFETVLVLFVTVLVAIPSRSDAAEYRRGQRSNKTKYEDKRRKEVTKVLDCDFLYVINDILHFWS